MQVKHEIQYWRKVCILEIAVVEPHMKLMLSVKYSFNVFCNDLLTDSSLLAHLVASMTTSSHIWTC